MKAAFLLGLTFGVFSIQAWAQTSPAELTCRAQAKEVAAQAYSSCITEARNSQVDEIRRNYEKDLQELKSKYDQELKKFGAAAAAKTASDGAPDISSLPAKKSGRSMPAKVSKAQKQAKVKKTKAKALGLAQKLPPKRTTTREAMPIQSPVLEDQVIAVQRPPASPSYDSETFAEPLEREAQVADQFEIVEMPFIEE